MVEESKQININFSLVLFAEVKMYVDLDFVMKDEDKTYSLVFQSFKQSVANVLEL